MVAFQLQIIKRCINYLIKKIIFNENIDKLIYDTNQFMEVNSDNDFKI